MHTLTTLGAHLAILAGTYVTWELGASLPLSLCEEQAVATYHCSHVGTRDGEEGGRSWLRSSGGAVSWDRQAEPGLSLNMGYRDKLT